eukprot:6175703-Amphidinium_carterae.1
MTLGLLTIYAASVAFSRGLAQVAALSLSSLLSFDTAALYMCCPLEGCSSTLPSYVCNNKPD